MKITYSACTTLLLLTAFAHAQVIKEVSKLSPTTVQRIEKPATRDTLKQLVVNSKLPIAVAGGRFSQGGQIACPDGLVIDICNLNKIINLDIANKTITVEPGVRWHDIQQHIDPYDLSIQGMQSYNDFTVGGSLSVNVHGRSSAGSLIKTVRSIKVMMSDGSIKEASREIHSDLFYAALGGYGLMGIIVEATLQLTDNEKIERHVELMPTAKYVQFFTQHIRDNNNVVFHNANIYPNKFGKVLSITWYKSKQMLTIPERLQPYKKWYPQEMALEQLLRRISFVKKLRSTFEPKKLQQHEVVLRNYEMSYSVKSLEPLIRFPTTSILQEYFVPMNKLHDFIAQLSQIVHQHNINLLNVSIRYVPKDDESLLAYAQQDCFAFVLYINVPRTIEQKEERRWTRKLINAALSVGGTYYLPYHLYATKAQFKKAYPKHTEFMALKSKYDPNQKFQNSLHKKYLAS